MIPFTTIPTITTFSAPDVAQLASVVQTFLRDNVNLHQVVDMTFSASLKSFTCTVAWTTPGAINTHTVIGITSYDRTSYDTAVQNAINIPGGETRHTTIAMFGSYPGVTMTVLCALVFKETTP